ncbi:Piso0_002954 [Millerozyma farinosa CBS 7064]|uniref:Piso0_002954 protein n=1 Tax=Pichia sorbitophila (strain ATCC MYA-4447 / BCRC 22081 / CBS 7064 / NBRC 10061 / NRRL Y-12695) TaxID=559304 RepID=G8YGS5_PICSO|nr:Piso0_002954 [Millerozyma farinosa CBS 7064]CCE80627.1 Piso0_002954 [Millerozyma farinosa CBS 7064]
MKPVVSTGKAYFCTILSAFGVVILSFIGYLFKTEHESMMGSLDDPTDGEAVAKTVFGAVFVYLGFLVFCGLQILIGRRNSRIQLN